MQETVTKDDRTLSSRVKKGAVALKNKGVRNSRGAMSRRRVVLQQRKHEERRDSSDDVK